jgi:hypothetical protein
MTLNEYLDHVPQRKPIRGGSAFHRFMIEIANGRMRITVELNNTYHEPAEVRALFSLLFGKPVPDSFGLLPPFTADFG